MNHNPYHIILLKKLIVLEAQLHFKKIKATKNDIRDYIATISEEFIGKRTPEQFGNHIMQYVWDKNVFDFKESLLDQLCRVLVLTKKVESWKDFQFLYNNEYSKYSEKIFTGVVYFRLSLQEQMAIEGFVDSTISLYTSQGYITKDEFSQIPDLEKMADTLAKDSKKRERFLQILSNFFKEYQDILKSGSILGIIITCIFLKFSVLKIVLICLAIILIDMLTFFIITRKQKFPPAKIFLRMLQSIFISSARAKSYKSPFFGSKEEYDIFSENVIDSNFAYRLDIFPFNLDVSVLAIFSTGDKEKEKELVRNFRALGQNIRPIAGSKLERFLQQKKEAEQFIAQANSRKEILAYMLDEGIKTLTFKYPDELKKIRYKVYYNEKTGKYHLKTLEITLPRWLKWLKWIL